MASGGDGAWLLNFSKRRGVTRRRAKTFRYVRGCGVSVRRCHGVEARAYTAAWWGAASLRSGPLHHHVCPKAAGAEVRGQEAKHAVTKSCRRRATKSLLCVDKLVGVSGWEAPRAQAHGTPEKEEKGLESAPPSS